MQDQSGTAQGQPVAQPSVPQGTPPQYQYQQTPPAPQGTQEPQAATQQPQAYQYQNAQLQMPQGYQAQGYNPQYGQQPYQQQYQQPIQQQYQAAPPATQGADTGSVGWAVLGFFIPLVGLILWLVWKDTRPMDSQRAKTGCLIGVAVWIGLSICMTVVTSCMATSMIHSTSVDASRTLQQWNSGQAY